MRPFLAHLRQNPQLELRQGLDLINNFKFAFAVPSARKRVGHLSINRSSREKIELNFT